MLRISESISSKLKSVDFIYRFYKKIKSIHRSFLRHLHKIAYGKVTKSDLLFFFKNEIGIKEGETWMVHSSLNSMGFVEGGAETVIGVLIEVLGKEGTLVMPSFPARGKNADYVKRCRTFDVLNTPSAMGVITETFRKMHGVCRSMHLTDSVCAWGKHAQYLTSEHHHCLRPHEKNSPFERFISLKGKILLIGVHLDTLTLLHASEDATEDFKYPVYLKEPVEYDIMDGQGNVIKSKTLVHNPEMSARRRCNDLWKHFINEGFAFEKKYKGCSYKVIEADKMHQWLLYAYRRKGITMYTPDGV
jgi:aminoglycoside 3-N-acetyltransferase